MNKNDRWNAQHYKKHSQVQYKGGIDLINTLSWNGDENVLDIGCGDGRITAEIAKKVPQGYVLGIDISPNMIDEANKNFGDIKNLEFQCIDATKFSKNTTFDRVVSFATFHWIREQQEALKNIYNVLKPDGIILIKMGLQHQSPISRMYENKKWRNKLQKDETYFPQTVESFSAVLKLCDFKNIEVYSGLSTRQFQSKDELFNWLFAWVPHSTGLPTDKAKEFTQDIVESICASSKDGDLIMETKHLIAKAEK